MEIRTKYTYIAFDGTEFDNETACVDYEAGKQWKAVAENYDLIFYDSEGCKITVDCPEAYADDACYCAIFSRTAYKFLDEVCDNYSLQVPGNPRLTDLPAFFAYSEGRASWVNLTGALLDIIPRFKMDN